MGRGLPSAVPSPHGCSGARSLIQGPRGAGLGLGPPSAAFPGAEAGLDQVPMWDALPSVPQRQPQGQVIVVFKDLKGREKGGGRFPSPAALPALPEPGAPCGSPRGCGDPAAWAVSGSWVGSEVAGTGVGEWRSRCTTAPAVLPDLSAPASTWLSAPH